MLKKLKAKAVYNHHLKNHQDISRIVQIFAQRGYDISEADACLAWEQFSDSMEAGWMVLGSDEEVFDDVFHYFEDVG